MSPACPAGTQGVYQQCPLLLFLLLPFRQFLASAMGKDTFTLAGREWPKVKWWRMKGMRFVYLTLWAAMITSATNGGSEFPIYSLRN